MFKKMFTRFSKVVAAGLVLSFMFLVPGAEASHRGLSGGLQTHDPTIVRESGNTWWSASTGTGIGMKYSTNGGKTWTDGLPIPFLSSEKIIPLSDLYPAPAFPKVTGEMTA